MGKKIDDNLEQILILGMEACCYQCSFANSKLRISIEELMNGYLFEFWEAQNT